MQILPMSTYFEAQVKSMIADDLQCERVEMATFPRFEGKFSSVHFERFLVKIKKYIYMHIYINIYSVSCLFVDIKLT